MNWTEIFLVADYADCFPDPRHPRNPRSEKI